MNREIKFRAWDKKLFIMISEDEMTGLKEYGRGRNTISSILDNEDYDVCFSFAKNKNETRIFNGDIVKGKGFRGRREVIINNDGYMLKGFNPLFFNAGMIKHFIVIGNIYENPELLP